MTIIATLLSYLTLNPSPLRLPQTSLHLSQQAPLFLASPDASRDTQETWLVYEQLLLSCLRTGDDESARLCLQRLSDRFGAESQRICALRGLYDEATARDRAELEGVCRRYEEVLKEDPTNMPIEKRRIALLTHLSRPDDAIKALTTLLSHSPNDAESWCHLSALYFRSGLYPQSLFCLEEVLLILPNAYNIFARLAEVAYVASDGRIEQLLDSMKHYARSVELCEWYLRGWYGLKLVTARILERGAQAVERAGVDRAKVEGLNEVATRKLVEIVGRARRREKGWEGFDEAEVEAARVLVEGSELKNAR